jgi:hypothetical protein
VKKNSLDNTIQNAFPDVLHSKMKSIFIVSTLICLLLIFLAPGCGQPRVEPDAEEISPMPSQEKPPSEPSSPLQVTLYISHAPLLNEIVEVICTISSLVSCPNSTAEVRLPDGATLVSGNLTWEGDVEPGGEPVSFSTEIVFHKTGHWKIEGVVRYMYNETSGWSDLDTIYLNIGADHSEFGWPRTGPVGLEQVEPGDVEPIPSTSTEDPDIEEYPSPPSIPVD